MWECRDQLNRKYFPPHEPLDAQKCVRICAVASLKEMVPPGVLAVITPLVVGTALGPKGLLGLLVGAISSGFLLAVMMSNAGGAWDNAKKYVEKGELGPNKAKHSNNHKAVVVGDTVGDPFKDTSGPSLNILIKLMSIVSLVISPILVKDDANGDEVPKDDWEDWWAALIIIGVLLILGRIYLWLMERYGQIHARDFIFVEAEKRKADIAKKAAAGGAAGAAKGFQEEEKGSYHDDGARPLGNDISLDNVAKKKGGGKGKLPGDAEGNYGSMQ